MKLAEALILRADCQKRIAQLKSRLLTNAKVQEGDAPAETPQDLIVELERAASELLDLIRRINRTNSATAFAGRGTISDALAGVMYLRCNALLTPIWRQCNYQVLICFIRRGWVRGTASVLRQRVRTIRHARTKKTIGNEKLRAHRAPARQPHGSG